MLNIKGKGIIGVDGSLYCSPLPPAELIQNFTSLVDQGGNTGIG